MSRSSTIFASSLLFKGYMPQKLYTPRWGNDYLSGHLDDGRPLTCSIESPIAAT